MRAAVWRGPVSAVSASPAAVGSISMDPVRTLQHTLYRAAKADPGRRFHALSDKVYRRDVLERAWAAVRRNNGAPGIDATTLADVEEYGVARLLDELATELCEGGYRPLPARRVHIPKPGTGEVTVQVVAGIQTFPLVSSVRTSKGPPAVLGRGRQVRPHGGEDLGAGEGAQAP